MIRIQRYFPIGYGVGCGNAPNYTCMVGHLRPMGSFTFTHLILIRIKAKIFMNRQKRKIKHSHSYGLVLFCRLFEKDSFY